MWWCSGFLGELFLVWFVDSVRVRGESATIKNVNELGKRVFDGECIDVVWELQDDLLKEVYKLFEDANVLEPELTYSDSTVEIFECEWKVPYFKGTCTPDGKVLSFETSVTCDEELDDALSEFCWYFGADEERLMDLYRKGKISKSELIELLEYEDG